MPELDKWGVAIYAHCDHCWPLCRALHRMPCMDLACTQSRPADVEVRGMNDG